MSIKNIFKSNKGALPTILYLAPIFLWLIGGAYSLLGNAFQNENIKTQIKAVTMAVDLQKDINYISTKTKASEIFSLSKKEMQHEEKNENFLLKKVKNKLNKSVYSKSIGEYDERLKGYDEDLDPLLADSLHDTAKEVKTTALDDVSYVMDKIKEDKKSKYHMLERQRKERIEAAKAKNKARRLDIDKSDSAETVEAYKRGVASTQANYAMLGVEETPPKVKEKNNDLTFGTTTGQKDLLKINVLENKEEESKDENLSVGSIDPFVPRKNTLKAVIDQEGKFRNGDKVQIRILENNFYNDVPIYKNTTLHGLCNISENRLFVTISSINLGEKILPVRLTVYDMDGMKGIYIDGAYNSELRKDLINQGLSDAGKLGLRNTIGDISIKLGRKTNSRTAAFIPTSYPVLLINEVR